MRRKLIIVVIVVIFCLQSFFNYAQVKTAKGELLAPTPPMGWMTWNYFGCSGFSKNKERYIECVCKAIGQWRFCNCHFKPE